jgi:hypothetical protein
VFEWEEHDFKWEKEKRLRKLGRNLLNEYIKGLAKPYQVLLQPKLDGKTQAGFDPDDWQIPDWTDLY